MALVISLIKLAFPEDKNDNYSRVAKEVRIFPYILTDLFGRFKH